MSKAATNKDRRKLEALPYAPEGCPINVGKQKCGETVGLDIIMDFHKLYQEKMSEIDVSAGGDSLQEKVNLQEQWIEDLTAQNKLLARVIEELESETIGRVQKLEDKLNNAVKSFGEDGSRAMEEKEKKIEKLKDDLKALPAAEKDLKKLDEESERLKQVHQLKQFKEMLPAIAEVKEQEIITQDNLIRDIQPEEQPIDNRNKNQQDQFDEFVKNIKSQSSPPPIEDTKLPKCKDYCYLWKLFSEITDLKLQVNLKNELLVQQLNIIKVLATKLFIMENSLKRLVKTPDEMLANDVLPEQTFRITGK